METCIGLSKNNKVLHEECTLNECVLAVTVSCANTHHGML